MGVEVNVAVRLLTKGVQNWKGTAESSPAFGKQKARRSVSVSTQKARYRGIALSSS